MRRRSWLVPTLILLLAGTVTVGVQAAEGPPVPGAAVAGATPIDPEILRAKMAVYRDLNAEVKDAIYKVANAGGWEVWVLPEMDVLNIFKNRHGRQEYFGSVVGGRTIYRTATSGNRRVVVYVFRVCGRVVMFRITCYNLIVPLLPAKPYVPPTPKKKEEPPPCPEVSVRKDVVFEDEEGKEIDPPRDFEWPRKGFPVEVIRQGDKKQVLEFSLEERHTVGRTMAKRTVTLPAEDGHYLFRELATPGFTGVVTERLVTVKNGKVDVDVVCFKNKLCIAPPSNVTITAIKRIVFQNQHGKLVGTPSSWHWPTNAVTLQVNSRVRGRSHSSTVKVRSVAGQVEVKTKVELSGYDGEHVFSEMEIDGFPLVEPQDNKVIVKIKDGKADCDEVVFVNAIVVETRRPPSEISIVEQPRRRLPAINLVPRPQLEVAPGESVVQQSLGSVGLALRFGRDNVRCGQCRKRPPCECKPPKPPRPPRVLQPPGGGGKSGDTGGNGNNSGGDGRRDD